jgi:bacteriocin biosynthesis cyclodehydratase domain-containing protein
VIKNPEFNPAYSIVFVNDEAAYLVSESGHIAIKGPGPMAVARAIHEGSPTVRDLVDAGFMPVHGLYLMLARWELTSYIRERGTATHPLITVGLVLLASIDGDVMSTALRDAGHVVVDADTDHDITVVLVDDYLNAALPDLNARQLELGRPWLLARPGGQITWVGPFITPGETACWECLANRLRQARQVETYLGSRVGHLVHPPFKSEPASMAMASGIIIDWLGSSMSKSSPSFGTDLLTYTRADGTLMRHHLVRRPQCPACGDGSHSADRPPQPVELKSSPKSFRSDGGHRMLNPRETIAKYQHHISPITGAVTALEPTPTGDSSLINVVFAGHNLAMRRGNLDGLKSGLRHASAGKGITPDQARASGLCEALERFSGNYEGTESMRRGTLADIGEHAIDPRSVVHWSEQQYNARSASDQSVSSFNIVPMQYDPGMEIDWSPIWSLTEGVHKWLPTQMLYYGFPFPDEQFFAWGDSNGNAAGNTLEEAIAQGFFELVERDAVAIWWYNRLRRPSVDLSTFDDPYIGQLIDYYASLNREVWALDLTSDLGIPVVVAISRRIDRAPEEILFAFGSHFDPHIAVVRALTEMNQFLPAVMNVDRDGRYSYEDPESVRWWKTATVESEPHLMPSDGAATRMCDWVDLSTNDTAEDVRVAQRIIEDKGMQFLVLDQTRPDIGLPVAKVVVPGLRHFWARFGPGRLYDVPVEMGWLPSPRAEDDLNPIGIFI